MQSSQSNRKGVAPKPGVLPVRPTFKKAPDDALKRSTRLPQKKEVLEIQKIQSMGAEPPEKQEMSFPVESNILQVTQLNDAKDDDSLMGSVRSIDNRAKSVAKEEVLRSKSQMGERLTAKGDERVPVPKSSFYQASTTPVLPSRFSTQNHIIIDGPEGINNTVQSRRQSDINRPMETRRGFDNDHSVISTASGGNFNMSQDVAPRRRLSAVRLMSMHNEGDEEFFEGTLIRGKKSGFCRVLYSTSVYKEGFFVNGNLEGEALIKYANGVSVQGVFKNNQLSSNVLLTIDNTTYPIDYVQKDFHNDKFFVSDKYVLVVTVDSCKDLQEYTGQARVYFRNGYRLDAKYEQGLVSQNEPATLYDKFSSEVRGTIKHGINFETNGIAIFTTLDNKDEFMLLFKGEGTVSRKKKQRTNK